MCAPKVRLYIRVRLSDARSVYANPAWNRNPEELEVFQFFVLTGLREQEVMYTTWKNIDFAGKVVKVRPKPEMGFRIKDDEERSIPVLTPSSIPFSRGRGAALQCSSSRPQWSLPAGLPESGVLRGAQLCECVNKGGHSCATKPTCGEWGLHYVSEGLRRWGVLPNDTCQLGTLEACLAALWTDEVGSFLTDLEGADVHLTYTYLDDLLLHARRWRAIPAEPFKIDIKHTTEVGIFPLIMPIPGTRASSAAL